MRSLFGVVLSCIFLTVGRVNAYCPVAALYGVPYNTSCCLISSITCENGYVTKLDSPKASLIISLGLRSLSGTIPEDIGMLTNLTSMRLSGRMITGKIPDSIANLTKLVEFALLDTSVSGTLPSFLCELPKLRLLSVTYSWLGGTIPLCLFTSGLLDLGLKHNNFASRLPPEAFSFSSSLLVLDLRGTGMTGPMPANGRSIRTLRLSSNRLTGSIPAFLFSDETDLVDLSDNQLTGSLPASLMTAVKLSTLMASGNFLSGRLPELGSTLKLRSLLLGNNMFSGSIPPLSLTSLRQLDISNNMLVGTIPASFGAMDKLRIFSVRNNSLHGSLMFLGNCSEIATLDISYNLFNESLPVEITNLHNIRHLNLSPNPFSSYLAPDMFDKWVCNMTYLSQISAFRFPECKLDILRSLEIIGANISLLNMSIGHELLPHVESVVFRDCIIAKFIPPIDAMEHVVNLDFAGSKLDRMGLLFDAQSAVTTVISDSHVQLNRELSADNPNPPLPWVVIESYLRGMADCLVCVTDAITADIPFHIAATLFTLKGDPLFPILSTINFSNCGLVTPVAFFLDSDIYAKDTDNHCQYECVNSALYTLLSTTGNTWGMEDGWSGEELVAWVKTAEAQNNEGDTTFQLFPVRRYQTQMTRLYSPFLQDTLTVVDFSHNMLTREPLQPDGHCGLKHLSVLRLGHNNLSGEVLWSELGPSPLVELDLSENPYLSGRVLQIISVDGVWERLQRLQLSSTGLYVKLDTWQLTVPTLKELYLANMSALQGRLPKDMFQMYSPLLIRMDLSNNRGLYGALPASFWSVCGHCPHLAEISIKNSNFSWFDMDDATAIPPYLRRMTRVDLSLNPWMCDPPFIYQGIGNSSRSQLPPPETRVGCLPFGFPDDLQPLCDHDNEVENVTCTYSQLECGISIVPSGSDQNSLDYLSPEHTQCVEGGYRPCWHPGNRELMVQRDTKVTFNTSLCSSLVCQGRGYFAILHSWDPVLATSQEWCDPRNKARDLVHVGAPDSCLFEGDLTYSQRDGFPVVGTDGLRVGICVDTSLIGVIRVNNSGDVSHVETDLPPIMPPGRLPDRIRVTLADENNVPVDVGGLVSLTIHASGRQIHSQVQPLVGPLATFNLSEVVILPKTNLTIEFASGPMPGSLLFLSLQTFYVSVCTPTQLSYYDISTSSCVFRCPLTFECNVPGACPIGAVCDGSEDICVQPGYWRSSGVCVNTSVDPRRVLLIDKCPHLECHGMDGSTDRIGGCSDGHHGTMCSECDEGYVFTEKRSCKRCPTTAVSAVVMIVFCVAIVVWVVAVAITQLRASRIVVIEGCLGDETEEAMSELSLYLKLLLSVMQTSIVLDNFDVDWPGPIRSMQEFLVSILAFIDMIWIRCLIPRLKPFIVRLSVFSAIFMFLLLIMWMSVLSNWMRVRRKTSTEIRLMNKKHHWFFRRSTFVVLLSVLLYVLYSQATLNVAYAFLQTPVQSVPQDALAQMNFSEAANVSTPKYHQYLIMDMSLVVAPADLEYKRIVGIAYATGVVCVLGYPLSIILSLILLRKWLYKSYDVRAIMGIYIAGYRDNAVWFDMVRLCRNSLTILTSSFSIPQLQVGSVAALVIFELVLTLLFKPYRGGAQSVQVITLTCQSIQIIFVGVMINSFDQDATGVEALLLPLMTWTLVVLDVVVLLLYVVEIGSGILVLLGTLKHVKPYVAPFLRAKARFRASLKSFKNKIGVTSAARHRVSDSNHPVGHVVSLQLANTHLSERMTEMTGDLGRLYHRLRDLQQNPAMVTGWVQTVVMALAPHIYSNE